MYVCWLQLLSILTSPRLDINPLPNEKILDMTKLKAFADDKLNVARMMIFLLDGVENTVGKGENAGYQLKVGIVFSKASLFRAIKTCIVWERVKPFSTQSQLLTGNQHFLLFP